MRRVYPADCCFSELALKIPTRRVGIVQRGHLHHELVKVSHNCSHYDIQNVDERFDVNFKLTKNQFL